MSHPIAHPSLHDIKNLRDSVDYNMKCSSEESYDDCCISNLLVTNSKEMDREVTMVNPKDFRNFSTNDNNCSNNIFFVYNYDKCIGRKVNLDIPERLNNFCTNGNNCEDENLYVTNNVNCSYNENFIEVVRTGESFDK